MNLKTYARIAGEAWSLMLCLFCLLFGLISSWLHLGIGAARLNSASLPDTLAFAAVAAFITLMTLWAVPTLGRLACFVMRISDAPVRAKKHGGMRTMDDIRAANPNAGKDPFPIFTNVEEPDEPQGDYGDAEAFAETVDMLSKYLPEEKT